MLGYVEIVLIYLTKFNILYQGSRGLQRQNSTQCKPAQSPTQRSDGLRYSHLFREYEYEYENESFSKTILACYLGAQVGYFREKKGQKVLWLCHFNQMKSQK